MVWRVRRSSPGSKSGVALCFPPQSKIATGLPATFGNAGTVFGVRRQSAAATALLELAGRLDMPESSSKAVSPECFRGCHRTPKLAASRVHLQVKKTVETVPVCCFLYPPG
jgi:hypothetical protein